MYHKHNSEYGKEEFLRICDAYICKMRLCNSDINLGILYNDRNRDGIEMKLSWLNLYQIQQVMSKRRFDCKAATLVQTF